MNKTANILLASSTAVLLSSLAVSAAPLVSLVPPSQYGCEFTVDVLVNDEVVGLTGYDLLIGFDETVLSVVGASVGALPSNSPYLTFFYWTDEGNVSDTLMINGAVLGGSVDGPGQLATITFRGLINESSVLDFLTVSFRDIDNVSLPITGQGTSVAVGDLITLEVIPAAETEDLEVPFDRDIELGQGLQDVSAIEVLVDFDETILDLLGVSEGLLLATHPDVLFAWEWMSVGEDSLLRISAEIEGGGDIDGPGSFATIEFFGTNGGSSAIDLVSADVERTVSPPLGPCLVDGMVTIDAGVVVKQLHWGMIKSLYR